MGTDDANRKLEPFDLVFGTQFRAKGVLHQPMSIKLVLILLSFDQ